MQTLLYGRRSSCRFIGDSHSERSTAESKNAVERPLGFSIGLKACLADFVRCVAASTSLGMPAKLMGERVSIRRRIRLVAITGADCEIEASTIHRETSARFVRRTDATIYD